MQQQRVTSVAAPPRPRACIALPRQVQLAAVQVRVALEEGAQEGDVVGRDELVVDGPVGSETVGNLRGCHGKVACAKVTSLLTPSEAAAAVIGTK